MGTDRTQSSPDTLPLGPWELGRPLGEGLWPSSLGVIIGFLQGTEKAICLVSKTRGIQLYVK